jgi:hypothetical protein
MFRTGVLRLLSPGARRAQNGFDWPARMNACTAKPEALCQSCRRPTVLRRLIRATTLAAAVAVLMPFAAQAADPGTCRDYAEAAIRQVRDALDNPRCQSGLKGPRWLADFQGHYNWCLTVGYAAIGSERDARTAYLRACR